MTPLDGLLVIAGFVLGCLPVIRWRKQRRSFRPRPAPQRLASSSPWI